MAAPDLSKLTIDRTAGARPGGQIGNARSRRNRWLKIGLGLLVVLAVALIAGRRLIGNPGVESATVTLAYPSQNYTLLNATGYAVAQRKASLSSKATGRLEWLGVLEGSKVKQNELIARLENRDVAASLSQSRANVDMALANREQGQAELFDAERAYRRSVELLAQKYISQASHDTAQARLNRAKAAISAFQAAIAVARAAQQGAQVAFDQTLIRAPFDGVILTKNANVGDNITPFSSAADSKGAVVTIADMDTLEVEADVSESNLAKIKVNQPCEIQFDAYPELRLAGTVSRMVPTLDRTKATLLVKVRFVERDPRVLPDMSAKVAFLSGLVPPAEKKPVTALAPAALVMRDGKQVVFVINDGKLRQTVVSVGPKVGELVAVQGVKAGDKVVLKPDEKLHDGSPVSLVKK